MNDVVCVDRCIQTMKHQYVVMLTNHGIIDSVYIYMMMKSGTISQVLQLSVCVHL